MVNQQNNTRKTLYTTSNNSLRFIYTNIVLANSGRDFYHAWYYWSNFTRHADNSVSYSGCLGGLKGMASDGCVVVKPPQVWTNPAGLASKWDSTA